MRLSLHCYDTKALEKMLKISSTSKFGPCPLCRLIHSGRSEELSKVVYDGHGCLLDQYHLLRFRGQSQHCCPPGFHNPNELTTAASVERRKQYLEDTSIKSTHPKFKPLVWEGEHAESKSALNGLSSPQMCCDCDAEISASIRDICGANRQKRQLVWHHHSIRPTLVTQFTYYKYCDFRLMKRYKRVPNDIFVQDAREAEQTSDGVNGVKGLWYFGKLSYTRVDKDVCYDPFHVLKNWAAQIMELYNGDRGIHLDKWVRYGRRCNSFPFLHEEEEEEVPTDEGATAVNDGAKKAKSTKKSEESKDSTTTGKQKGKKVPPTIPWKIEPKDMKAIDGMLECVLLPTGYSNDFRISNPFMKFGELTGKQKIDVFTIYMEFIVFLKTSCLGKVRSADAYEIFLTLVQENFIRLQAPKFTDFEVDELL